MAMKGNSEDPCGGRTVLYLDCVHVNILVVVVCFNFARLSHWGKPIKLYMGFVCIISDNCM